MVNGGILPRGGVASGMVPDNCSSGPGMARRIYSITSFGGHQNGVKFGCWGHRKGVKFGCWETGNGVTFGYQGHPNGEKFQSPKRLN